MRTARYLTVDELVEVYGARPGLVAARIDTNGCLPAHGGGARRNPARSRTHVRIDTSRTSKYSPASRVRRFPTIKGDGDVPLFLDVHTVEGGVSAADVADAHMKDLKEQAKHGVNYKNYWVDEKAGKIFCLVEAPNAEAAHTVHREAHGLVAEEIYEVQQG
jgi:hypothetical protein